jgi:hypothetical protein
LAQCPRGASRAPTGRLGRQLTDTLVALATEIIVRLSDHLRKGRSMVRFRCNLDRGRLCPSRFRGSRMQGRDFQDWAQP